MGGKKMSWNKSYDVIIPAQVRFDYVLPMGAKLMYGDLCALAKDKGYCDATNTYLAWLYDVSTVTIADWLFKLEQQGYISREITYQKGTKKINGRKIFIKNAR